LLLVIVELALVPMALLLISVVHYLDVPCAGLNFAVNVGTSTSLSVACLLFNCVLARLATMLGFAKDRPLPVLAASTTLNWTTRPSFPGTHFAVDGTGFGVAVSRFLKIRTYLASVLGGCGGVPLARLLPATTAVAALGPRTEGGDLTVNRARQILVASLGLRHVGAFLAAISVVHRN